MAKFISQLYFQTPHRHGVIASIAKVLGRKKINILALEAHTRNNRGQIFMSTSDDAEAKKILMELGYRPKLLQALSINVANKAGRLAPVLLKLAKATVTLNSCFLTCDKNRTAEVILNTNNNKKAAKILKIQTVKRKVLAGAGR